MARIVLFSTNRSRSTLNILVIFYWNFFINKKIPIKNDQYIQGTPCNRWPLDGAIFSESFEYRKQISWLRTT